MGAFRALPDALDPWVSFLIWSSHGDTFRNRLGWYQRDPFFVCNAIGAAVRAVIVAFVGYLFGALAKAVLVDVRQYEHWIIPGILCAGVLVWFICFLHDRAKSRPEP